MNRRRLIAGMTAAAASLAGCAGVAIRDPGPDSSETSSQTESEPGYSFRLDGESEYIKTVNANVIEGVFPLPGELEIGITLHESPPETPSGLVFLVDSDHVEARSINLGQTSVTVEDTAWVDHLTADSEVELLLVQGGEIDWNTWDGGEILERVPLVVT